MKKVFVIGDTHFNHKNIIQFEPKYRKFKDVEEMNEVLIKNWNDVVNPQDWVIHLGDFALGRVEKIKSFRERLNGKIVLIRGNHDPTKAKCLSAGFERVYNSISIRNLLFTHKPQTVDKLENVWYNIHGHTHSKEVFGERDHRYINMSCEVIRLSPYEITSVISAEMLEKEVGWNEQT